MAPYSKGIAQLDASLTAKHYYAYRVAWDRFTAEGGYSGTLRSVYRGCSPCSFFPFQVVSLLRQDSFLLATLFPPQTSFYRMVILTLRSSAVPAVLNHVKMDPFLFPHLNMHYTLQTFPQGLRVPSAADIAQAVEKEFRREKGISLSLDAARDVGQQASLFCQTAKTKITEAIKNKVWIVNRAAESDQPVKGAFQQIHQAYDQQNNAFLAGPSQPHSSPYFPSSEPQEEPKGYPFSAVKQLMHAEGYEKVTQQYIAKASEDQEIRSYQVEWQRQRDLEDGAR